MHIYILTQSILKKNEEATLGEVFLDGIYDVV
jgi:hypothetical protein